MEILVIAIAFVIVSIVAIKAIKTRHDKKQIIRQHTAINNTLADLVEKNAFSLDEQGQNLLKSTTYQPQTHLEHLILLYAFRKEGSITLRDFYIKMSVHYTYNLRSQVFNMTEHNKDYAALDFDTPPSQRVEKAINEQTKDILPFLIIGNMEGTSADKSNAKWKDLNDSCRGRYSGGHRSRGSGTGLTSGADDLLGALVIFDILDN